MPLVVHVSTIISLCLSVTIWEKKIYGFRIKLSIWSCDFGKKQFRCFFKNHSLSSLNHKPTHLFSLYSWTKMLPQFGYFTKQHFVAISKVRSPQWCLVSCRDVFTINYALYKLYIFINEKKLQTMYFYVTYIVLFQKNILF